MSEKTFQVTVMRTESRNYTFTVQAEDRDQAEELAMERSNDLDWTNARSVHHADEQVIEVKEGKEDHPVFDVRTSDGYYD